MDTAWLRCLTVDGACGCLGVGRCDCPRHRWGRVCELHVQPALSRTSVHHGWCVYNDSSAFFCDKVCMARIRLLVASWPPPDDLLMAFVCGRAGS